MIGPRTRMYLFMKGSVLGYARNRCKFEPVIRNRMGKNLGRFKKLNIRKYEHFTRRINKT